MDFLFAIWIENNAPPNSIHQKNSEVTDPYLSVTWTRYKIWDNVQIKIRQQMMTTKL